ncbi:MAG: hypothetical protein Q4G09_00180 [Clostridia bacterium]|nr:hypothetical protein [Clostridia bacterium]
MDDNKELAIKIINTFEELLSKYNIKLPSKDRNGEETEAAIYGRDYYELEDEITNIIQEENNLQFRKEQVAIISYYIGKLENDREELPTISLGSMDFEEFPEFCDNVVEEFNKNIDYKYLSKFAEDYLIQTYSLEKIYENYKAIKIDLEIEYCLNENVERIKNLEQDLKIFCERYSHFEDYFENRFINEEQSIKVRDTESLINFIDKVNSFDKTILKQLVCGIEMIDKDYTTELKQKLLDEIEVVELNNLHKKDHWENIKMEIIEKIKDIAFDYGIDLSNQEEEL